MNSRWGTGLVLATKISLPLLGFAMIAGVLLNAGPLSGAAVPRQNPPPWVPIADRQLYCPGPQSIGVRGAEKIGKAPTKVTIRAASVPAELRHPLVPGQNDQTDRSLTLAAIGAGQLAREQSDPGLVRASTADPIGVAVRGQGAAAVGLIAEQGSTKDDGDARGKASIPCVQAQHDTWLVGGGGEPGRRGYVVLVNPQAVTAEISIDVWSSAGLVARTAGSALALGPRSRVVVLLDALAPGVRAPVIRVRSAGASIVASLHDMRLLGTTAKGVDDVSASPPPARKLWVPGIIVAKDQPPARLRVLVPGTVEAVVQVTLFGPNGRVDLPREGVLRLPAGRATELNLKTLEPADAAESEDLAPGNYTVQLSADVDLIAGAMLHRGGTEDDQVADLAWSAGGRPLTGPAGVTGDADTTIVLSAPSESPGLVQVLRLRSDGSVQDREDVSVPPGSTREVAAVSSGSTWVAPRPGSGPILAARQVRSGELFSVTSVLTAPQVEPAVVVAPTRR